jgi:hypothetical protein
VKQLYTKNLFSIRVAGRREFPLDARNAAQMQSWPKMLGPSQLSLPPDKKRPFFTVCAISLISTSTDAAD